MLVRIQGWRFGLAWGSFGVRIIWSIPTLLTLRFPEKLPLDRNILAHPWHLNFYVPTRPKYSCAYLTPPFLCIFLTDIFLCPWHLNFYVPTWPKYSCAYLTPPFSTYLLDRNTLAHPWHLNFYVPTRPKYSCAYLTPPFLGTTQPQYSCASLTPQGLRSYSTKIFISISTYLLDRNILAHPQHLHFYVSSRPTYSGASPTPLFLHIFSSKIFLRIPDTSISAYLLVQNILCPRYNRARNEQQEDLVNYNLMKLFIWWKRSTNWR